MVGFAYVSRDDVAADTPLGFREAARVDRAILSASDAVERLCHRKFYPTTATRTIPLSPTDRRTAWLGESDLISVAQILDGTTAVTAYTLEPQNAMDGPFTSIEFTSAPAADEVSVTGVFGYCDDVTLVGTITAGINASVTTVPLSSGANVGVGDTLKIGAEYLTVTDMGWSDTGVNLAADVTLASAQDVVIALSGVVAGEVILIDAEQILIVAVAGSNVVGARGYNGSTLAAHTANADIYVRRSATVTRAMLGSTAATHDSAAVVSKLEAPALVRQYVIARALDTIQQESAGYARKAGSGDNDYEAKTPALRVLETQVKGAYGRNRSGGVAWQR